MPHLFDDIAETIVNDTQSRWGWEWGRGLGVGIWGWYHRLIYLYVYSQSALLQYGRVTFKFEYYVGSHSV